MAELPPREDFVPVCGSFQPVHEAYAMPYRCTKPHDHVGVHEAVIDGETAATWAMADRVATDQWRWESDGKGGWISAPRCREATCPDFGSWDFGEGTCPADHAESRETP